MSRFLLDAPTAKCRTVDPDLHHPIGAGNPAIRQAFAAIEVCVECPLMLACRADADERAAAGERLDEIAGGFDYNRQRRAAAARQHAPCGTERGYQWHRRRAKVTCGPCQRAHAEYQANKRKPCGTWAAYEQHRRRGERPCEPCAEACRRHGREKYRRQRQAKGAQLRKPSACGTPAAYAAHKHRGETPCDRCREARLAYQRKYRAARRERAFANQPAPSQRQLLNDRAVAS